MNNTYTHRGIVLPAGIQEDLDAYSNSGRPVGDFLQSCIENNLSMAIAYADDNSLTVIPAIVGYLYNRCPMGSYGRPGAFTEWIERKRKEMKVICAICGQGCRDYEEP